MGSAIETLALKRRQATVPADRLWANPAPYYRNRTSRRRVSESSLSIDGEKVVGWHPPCVCWKFLGDAPDLPQTRAMLMRACDARLPARLTRGDLDVITGAQAGAAEAVRGRAAA